MFKAVLQTKATPAAKSMALTFVDALHSATLFKYKGGRYIQQI